MKTFFKILGYIEDAVCILSIVVMLSLAFSNVIGRYVLHASISFTEEIVCGLFVLLSMMGTSIAVKYQTHLGLSIMSDHLPLTAQKWLSVIGNLIGFVFAVLLVKWGYSMCMTQIQLGSVSATLQWPAWIYGMALPIGAAFVAIRFLEAAICKLRGKEVA